VTSGAAIQGKRITSCLKTSSIVISYLSQPRINTRFLNLACLTYPQESQFHNITHPLSFDLISSTFSPHLTHFDRPDSGWGSTSWNSSSEIADKLVSETSAVLQKAFKDGTQFRF
ncbi:hypothetical protein PENTCL1PPCAC_12257, partial [Pristionchus entomophagus]